MHMNMNLLELSLRFMFIRSKFPDDNFKMEYIQNLDNNHFSSKPQHRWAEDGKELHELRHMIIKQRWLEL